MKLFNFILVVLSLSLVVLMVLVGVINGDFVIGDLIGWIKMGNVVVDISVQFGVLFVGFVVQVVLGIVDLFGFFFGGSVVVVVLLEFFVGFGVGVFVVMNVIVGLGLCIDFMILVGDWLVFQWKFMSNDLQGSLVDDMVYVVLDNVFVFKLISVNSVVFVGFFVLLLFDEIVYFIFISVLLSVGMYSVSLGVFDSVDMFGVLVFVVIDVYVVVVFEFVFVLLMFVGMLLLGLCW